MRERKWTVSPAGKQIRRSRACKQIPQEPCALTYVQARKHKQCERGLYAWRPIYRWRTAKQWNLTFWFLFFKDRMIDRQKKMMRYNIWSASENPWAAFTPSSSTLATAAWSHSCQYNLATFGDMSVSNHWRQDVGCVQRCHKTDTYANDSQWKWSQWSSRQSVLQVSSWFYITSNVEGLF